MWIEFVDCKENFSNSGCFIIMYFAFETNSLYVTARLFCEDGG